MNEDIDHKKISGEEIRKIRLSLGLTMDEFGRKFEPPASDSIVSRWERGVSLPNSKRIKRIIELSEQVNKKNKTDISNYLDTLYEQAKKRSKKNAEIVKDLNLKEFDLKEYDDLTNWLSIAIEQKLDIIDEGVPIDNEDENKNAIFIFNLYRIIERKRQYASHFDKETQSKLMNIISLLLSDARDIDISEIHETVTNSKPKKKE